MLTFLILIRSVYFKEGENLTFAEQPTELHSNNIEQIRSVYDYRCYVSGGERLFILGLGVSF